MTWGNVVSLIGAIITVISVIVGIAPHGLRELVPPGMRRRVLRVWERFFPRHARGSGMAYLTITGDGDGYAIASVSRFPDPSSSPQEFLRELERELHLLRSQARAEVRKERSEREGALVAARTEFDGKIERLAEEMKQVNLSGLRGQLLGSALVVLGIALDAIFAA